MVYEPGQEGLPPLGGTISPQTQFTDTSGKPVVAPSQAAR
jgi:hypothetical protein